MMNVFLSLHVLVSLLFLVDLVIVHNVVAHVKEVVIDTVVVNVWKIVMNPVVIRLKDPAEILPIVLNHVIQNLLFVVIDVVKKIVVDVILKMNQMV